MRHRALEQLLTRQLTPIHWMLTLSGQQKLNMRIKRLRLMTYFSLFYAMYGGNMKTMPIYRNFPLEGLGKNPCSTNSPSHMSKNWNLKKKACST